jgi:DNA invertase Pin-like site-specific DNA recombinase
VLHRCDNRACVNPDHLFLGTQADNMADMTAKGRNGYLTKPERIARGDRHAFMLHPERRPRGERNGSAKLTETTVRDIRALIATGGIGPVEIARRFGIHRTTVHRIVNRKIWRDLA